MDRPYRVEVYGLRGEMMFVDLCNTEEQMQTMTVRQLKEKIYDRMDIKFKEKHLRLIFAHNLLEDDSDLLSEYGIHHESIIGLVIRVPGGSEIRRSREDLFNFLDPQESKPLD